MFSKSIITSLYVKTKPFTNDKKTRVTEVFTSFFLWKGNGIPGYMDYVAHKCKNKGGYGRTSMIKPVFNKRKTLFPFTINN